MVDPKKLKTIKTSFSHYAKAMTLATEPGKEWAAVIFTRRSQQ